MMKVTWWGYFDCPECGGSVSDVQCPVCFKRAETERENIKFTTSKGELYGEVTVKEGESQSPLGRDQPWRSCHSTLPALNSLPPGHYELRKIS